MPIDLSKLHEADKRIAKPTEAAPPASAPPAEDPGAESRRELQRQRGALNAEGAAPGQEPTSDPIMDGLRAGRDAGSRGSIEAFEAHVEKTFAAAQAGDPRVMTPGVVDTATNERWQREAHERQVANRNESGMTHR